MTTQNAGLAKKLGYTNVKAFLGGEPAWIAAGHPLYASKDFVEKGNIVLLDLRDGDAVSKGRIPRSVNIPADDLLDRLDEIPLKAPIVLYSDNSEDVADAFDALSMTVINKCPWWSVITRGGFMRGVKL